MTRFERDPNQMTMRERIGEFVDTARILASDIYHSDNRRALVLVLGVGTPAVASGVAVETGIPIFPGVETAEAESKYHNNYHNNDPDPTTHTMPGSIVKKCIDMNVRYLAGDNDDSVWFKYPHGKIESQRVSTKVGRRGVDVITKLRDTNVDVSTNSHVELPLNTTMEFVVGCEYLTESSTSISLTDRKIKKAVSETKTVSYEDDPREFHPERFVTKTLKTELVLPKPLTKKDLRNGKYCVSSTQESRSITRPFDLSAVEESSPGQGYKLLDPTQNVGMIDYGSTMPSPKSKIYSNCITKTKQYTIKPPKNSPWTYYPY